MAKQKRIICRCHGALAAGLHYQTSWEDVWLRWKGKPGKTIYYAAPMIATRADVEAELKMDLRCDDPESVVYDQGVLADLDKAPYARDTQECPNIYTNADYIDRAEAERMLAWFLSDEYGIRNPKFMWKKPVVYVTTVSFAGIHEVVEEESSLELL